MKVINPSKKSDMTVRQLHKFHFKFSSVNALRVKLIEDFSEQVPDSLSFGVGYFDGKHQMSLFNQDDLGTMYDKHKLGGEIMLWCDARSRDSLRAGRKRCSDSDSGLLKRQEKEEELESVFKELKSKHGDKFSLPQLKLWSRMVSTGLHEDMDSPPDIPALRDTGKKPRKETLADAISNAAITFTKALSTSQEPNSTLSEATKSTTGVSPGKAVELRMKNLEQLRYLQNLYEDGILNDKEYSEQKSNILSSLRKL